MAWDDVKVDGTSTLSAAEWNLHVTDQKTRPASGAIIDIDINAAAAIAISKLAAGARHTSGTYLGDNNVNRAIPHGLGTTAMFVIIHGYDSNVVGVLTGAVSTRILSGGVTNLAVTAMDATNFYVGTAANTELNLTGKNFVWIAFG